MRTFCLAHRGRCGQRVPGQPYGWWAYWTGASLAWPAGSQDLRRFPNMVITCLIVPHTPHSSLAITPIWPRPITKASLQAVKLELTTNYAICAIQESHHVSVH